MTNGSVVFHRDIGYDFYLVSKSENGEYKIECIPMPKAGAFHRELSDEVIIGLLRSHVGQQVVKQELNKRIIDAYEALMGRK